VEFELPDIRVSGYVHVPRAQLSPDELPAQAAAPSEDTVVHGVEDSATSRALQMQAQLRLTLGEEVTYTGNGLTTAVSGALDLEYDSSVAATATGVVELAGDYEVFGESLSLERGRLIFAGPLGNPELDVRAVREIESRALASEAATAAIIPSQAGALRVGVDLTGTLLAYLTISFVVRVVTDLAAAGPSRLETRLRERISEQTDEIAKRTMERLANLLPSGPAETFHSGSFASLLVTVRWLLERLQQV